LKQAVQGGVTFQLLILLLDFHLVRELVPAASPQPPGFRRGQLLWQKSTRKHP
jgi:hypothetical protein